MSMPILETKSLRAHSKVLDMFTSSDRNRHSMRRHTRSAARANATNPSVRVENDGTPSGEELMWRAGLAGV